VSLWVSRTAPEYERHQLVDEAVYDPLIASATDNPDGSA
jgi:hypothetical protein